MDIEKFTDYPFLTRAAEYVAGMGLSIDQILSSREFSIPRSLARSRVLHAIDGEIEIDRMVPDIAVLRSYPIARILVSCIDDAFLTRRYALAEAKYAYSMMKSEEDGILIEIGQDFGIVGSSTKNGFRIHFTDYIRGAAQLRALNWKLVNRRLKSGFVTIKKEEYARLLQEGVRVRIFSSLPLEVPERFCQVLEDDINGVKAELEVRKTEFDEEGFGDVAPGDFPPCIIQLLSGAQGGVNLAHSARFALTSFLLNIGLSADQIIQMFNVSPDFNEEMTRYQVEHISGATGTTYKPPSCATMITYGNCFGRDKVCREIGHPLSYYRKKKQISKQQPENPESSGEITEQV